MRRSWHIVHDFLNFITNRNEYMPNAHTSNLYVGINKWYKQYTLSFRVWRKQVLQKKLQPAVVHTIQSRQTNMVCIKRNGNYYILQSRKRSIPSIKHASWVVEMQSFLSHPNPSISLLPIHDKNIPTKTKTDNAIVCDNK